MTEDEAPVWEEPPYLVALNDLAEALEGIQIALDRPERFAPETLQALAEEIQGCGTSSWRLRTARLTCHAREHPLGSQTKLELASRRSYPARPS